MPAAPGGSTRPTTIVNPATRNPYCTVFLTTTSRSQRPCLRIATAQVTGIPTKRRTIKPTNPNSETTLSSGSAPVASRRRNTTAYTAVNPPSQPEPADLLALLGGRSAVPLDQRNGRRDRTDEDDRSEDFRDGLHGLSPCDGEADRVDHLAVDVGETRSHRARRHREQHERDRVRADHHLEQPSPAPRRRRSRREDQEEEGDRPDDRDDPEVREPSAGAGERQATLHRQLGVGAARATHRRRERHPREDQADPVPPLPRGDQGADGRVEEDAPHGEQVFADAALAALDGCIHEDPDERERHGDGPDRPGEAPLAHGRRHRDASDDGRAVTGRRTDVDGAAERGQSVGDALESGAVRGGHRVEPDAIVDDLERQAPVRLRRGERLPWWPSHTSPRSGVPRGRRSTRPTPISCGYLPIPSGLDHDRHGGFPRLAREGSREALIREQRRIDPPGEVPQVAPGRRSSPPSLRRASRRRGPDPSPRVAPRGRASRPARPIAVARRRGCRVRASSPGRPAPPRSAGAIPGDPRSVGRSGAPTPPVPPCRERASPSSDPSDRPARRSR